MIFAVEDRLYCTTYIGIDRMIHRSGNKKWGQYVMRYDRALKRKEMGSDANEKEKREQPKPQNACENDLYLYNREKRKFFTKNHC
jgi:hypothetical protein